MKRHYVLRLFLFATLLGAVAAARAQQADADLNFAFGQLKSNGPAPFAKALYDTNSDAARQLAGQLEPFLRNAGEYIGFEVVSRKPLSSRIERIIIAIYYERRPVYLRIDSYQSSQMRVFLPALVSKEADEVLPAEIIAITGR